MDRRTLLLGGLSLAALGRDEQPLLERTDLWESGKDGYAIYRIPGLVRTARGVLLAYCEARKNAGSDWGRIDVMLRRSTDGGRTWSPSVRIVDPPQVPKNPVAAAQGLGKEGEVTVNNPVAIADRKRGVVHFLYCVEYNRCYYRRSTDDGESWSEPVDITPAFDHYRPEYDWKVLATGPGHGIQLRSGRLLVPVWLSTGTGGHAHRPSAVATVFSDDGGKRWQRGEIVVSHPRLTNPSETVAAELRSGEVLLNIRHEGPEKLRAVSLSPDGATGWSPVRVDPALPEPVCMGSLIRLPGRGDRLLFANPHNPTGRERRNLTLKLSEDGGRTWPIQRTLDPGNSAYSDLAASPDGTLYCLYERGVGTQQYRTLTLVRLNEAWVRDSAR